MTAISETVEAPEREMTRCAAAMRCAMSVKNGDTSAGDAEIGIGRLDLVGVLLACLLHDAQPLALRFAQ
jgi:hypothetical protein